MFRTSAQRSPIRRRRSAGSATSTGSRGNIYYGLGYPPFLNDLKAEGTWKPANGKIYIVEGDSVYSQTISKKCQEAAPGAGWQIAGVTKVTTGQADWAPSVKAAVDSGAAAIMNTHYAPDDLAKWTKAFAANPSKALVYLQYGPSIPAYAQLAGAAANGIIWATVTGVYDDAVGKIFRDAYQAKFGKPAGFSNSGSGYDAVNMLAKVWGQVGDGQNFEAVKAGMRNLIHRGVNGGYWLNKNAGLAYPVETPDAGLGQAHLFFQIQGTGNTILNTTVYSATGAGLRQRAGRSGPARGRLVVRRRGSIKNSPAYA